MANSDSPRLAAHRSSLAGGLALMSSSAGKNAPSGGNDGDSKSGDDSQGPRVPFGQRVREWLDQLGAAIDALIPGPAPVWVPVPVRVRRRR